MNYASIRTCDIANGEGVRVSLFVSGCTHCCPGCFNAEAQSFDYGEPFTREVEDSLLSALSPSHIAGLTLLGGEPLEPANQRALLPFVRRFRERYGDTKSLWIYTGCVLDADTLELRPSNFNLADTTPELLRLTDVLIDGPFVEAQKDIALRFRGSSNQRLLRLHPTVEML